MIMILIGLSVVAEAASELALNATFLPFLFIDLLLEAKAPPASSLEVSVLLSGYPYYGGGVFVLHSMKSTPPMF